MFFLKEIILFSAKKIKRMKLLNNNFSKITILAISFLFLATVGLIDYFTGSEISLLFFYLIPVFFLSLHRNSNKTLIVINTIIAAIVWFVSEYFSREYTNDVIPVWNALVRFFIFLSFGVLLRLLNERLFKLEELNKQLNQLNEEKNRFIGIASHDIKNPIGTISSFSDLLISDFSNTMDDEAKEIVGYIKELSTNSLHILKNVLDVSKIESGTIDLKIHKQDYIPFIKKQVFYHQIIAKKKDIQLNLETNLEEFFLDFDENYMTEVTSNLLSNAIKFCPDENGVIGIQIFEKEQFYEINVIDNGKGIDEKDADMIFDKFYQSDNQNIKKPHGSGLGLAICKQIIELHKGKIWANNMSLPIMA